MKQEQRRYGAGYRQRARRRNALPPGGVRECRVDGAMAGDPMFAAHMTTPVCCSTLPSTGTREPATACLAPAAA